MSPTLIKRLAVTVGLASAVVLSACSGNAPSPTPAKPTTTSADAKPAASPAASPGAAASPAASPAAR